MDRLFPISSGLFQHRRRMGPALWEFCWLVAHVTQDVEDGNGDFDGIVSYGHPIAARGIATDLRESVYAARAHLRRLEAGGYISRKLVSGETYTYVVKKSKKWQPKRNAARPEDLSAPVTESCTPPDKNVHRELRGNARPQTEICLRNKEEIEDREHRSSLTAKEAVKADSRHAPLAEYIQDCWLTANPEAPAVPWDGRAGKALNMLLKANPRWPMEQVRRCVGNRFASEENHGEEPRVWIPQLIKYFNGPLDRFGKPIGSANETRNHAEQKQAHLLSENERAKAAYR